MNQSFVSRPLRLLTILATLAVSACGGGGGGGSSSTPSSSTPGGTPSSGATTSVTGTAASGAPIANASVTLKDSAGTSRSATTSASGAYTIDTSGLKPPFFVQVVKSGTNIYSVSADANNATTINLTPLTDLIVRSWYSVQGVNVDTAFAAPATNPPPAPTEVQIIAKVVQDVVQLWLNNAGVTAANFNLISTPFTADHTGVDQVLDRTSVNPSTGTISITDGTTTQSTTLTADRSSDTISVSTVTSDTSGNSSASGESTVVPVQTAQQQALDAITASLNTFANVVNTKGTSLAVSDVLPLLDPNLLDDGRNATQFATDLVDEFSSGVTLSFGTPQIESLDLTNNVAQVRFSLTETHAGQSETDTGDFFFTKVNNAWLLSGDQRIASISLRAEARTNQGAFTGNNGPQVQVDLEAPVGAVSAATITGGVSTISGATVFNSTPFLKTGILVDPAGNLDHFFAGSTPNPAAGIFPNPPALMPAGTPFTINIAKAAGGSVTYTVPSNSFTTEQISITNLTGSTLADAHVGTPLTVQWTLPKTYAVARVRLTAQAFTTADQTDPSALICAIDNVTVGAPILSNTATSGQITIPATCSGQPTLSADVNVNVSGVNGEHSEINYQFK